MRIPREYTAWFESLGFREISFGVGGLKLFSPDELEDSQEGYSISPEGENLCNGASGSWRPEWIVIGNDTAIGDPIFVDTSAPGLLVMTAMQGEDSWEPHAIASSLAGFATALRSLQSISSGREHPVGLEQNPLSEEERSRVLNDIRAAVGPQAELDFWEIMLEG